MNTRNRSCGAPMADAGRPCHAASYPRSARSASTAPSARRRCFGSRWSTHHGHGSTVLSARACRSPLTFSAITSRGFRWSMAVAMATHSPERVESAPWADQAGASPAVADVLAGKPAGEHVHRLDGGPVDGGEVAVVRHARPPVRQHSGRGGAVVGEPHRTRTEDLFDGDVQAAVPGEQRTDREPVHAATVRGRWAPARSPELMVRSVSRVPSPAVAAAVVRVSRTRVSGSEPPATSCPRAAAET